MSCVDDTFSAAVRHVLLETRAFLVLLFYWLLISPQNLVRNTWADISMMLSSLGFRSNKQQAMWG